MDVVDRFVEAVPELPGPPPGDPGTLFRRGRRRRRRRLAVVSSGTAVGVIAVVAVAVGLLDGPDRQVPDIADRPAGELVERAPDAGVVDEHWPVELTYVQNEREFRFRGTSWADWSVELKVGQDSWRLVDREHPVEEYETEGAGAFRDEGTSSAESEGFLRAPGPHLIGSWRSATGLGERVVVELEAIPGGVELVQQMGLSSEDVEAYVTPSIAGCDGRLPDCVPAGQSAARGIAHLPTGFPLFAEEGHDGGSGVYLEARSIRWADSSIAPVPADQIPRMSDHAAADAERAAGRSQLRHGSLTDRTFELGSDHLWSAIGHPSEVATRFAREVMGWTDAEPIDLTGDLPERATVTVRADGMREVTFDLEALDPTGERYGITQVNSRPDQELRIEDDHQLRWAPSVPHEVAGGLALVRTVHDGTVRIDLDPATTADGRVSLDGHLTAPQPCQNAQAALIAILDDDGRVIEITGAHWNSSGSSLCP